MHCFAVSHAEHQSGSRIHQSIFIMRSYLLHQKKLPWQAKRPSLDSMIWPTRFQLRSLVNITGLISQSQSSIFPSPAWVQLRRLVTRQCRFKFNPEYQELYVRSVHHITSTYIFTPALVQNDKNIKFLHLKFMSNFSLLFLMHYRGMRNILIKIHLLIPDSNAQMIHCDAWI